MEEVVALVKQLNGERCDLQTYKNFCTLITIHMLSVSLNFDCDSVEHLETAWTEQAKKEKELLWIIRPRQHRLGLDTKMPHNILKSDVDRDSVERLKAARTKQAKKERSYRE